jgi:bifunctional DNA-binding transcriptional regulator/antitoxin component of YhaV-PrlF toxin-antitoxin module
MGYPTKVQLIKRQKTADQYYINFPTAIAEAMEFEKGETVEWLIEDKSQLVLRRLNPPATAIKKKPRASSNSSKPSGAKEPKPSGSNESPIAP